MHPFPLISATDDDWTGSFDHVDARAAALSKGLQTTSISYGNIWTNLHAQQLKQRGLIHETFFCVALLPNFIYATKPSKQTPLKSPNAYFPVNPLTRITF